MRHYHLEYEEVLLASTSLHSRLAWHSRISGAFTFRAGSGVSLNVSNLLIALPDELPMPTTAPGRNVDHVFLAPADELETVIAVRDHATDQ
jgi:hypothetical protein